MTTKLTMRLYQGRPIGHAHPTLIDIEGHSYNPLVFRISGDITGTTDVRTEIAAPTAEISCATSATLSVVTSSSSDTYGGSSVTQVNVIGVNASGYFVETVQLDGGATATTTKEYTDAMHMYSSGWGGNPDAEGTIDLVYATNTTLATISAGENESNGAKVYVRSGYRGGLLDMHLQLTDSALSAQGDGLILHVGQSAFDSTGNTDPDYPYKSFIVTGYGPHATITDPGKTFEAGTSTATYTLYEQEYGSAEGANLDVEFVVWKTTKYDGGNV